VINESGSCEHFGRSPRASRVTTLDAIENDRAASNSVSYWSV
jgi:hypothetical protein